MLFLRIDSNIVCHSSRQRNALSIFLLSSFYRYDSKTGQSPNMPREQQNAMTSWIDGSFVYSTKESWVNAMRSFENGSLAMEGDPTKGMPPLNRMRVPLVNAPAPHLLTKLNPERMFLLGDPRTNQNPAFLVMGILFYRWHNYQALSPANCFQSPHSDL